MSDFFRAFCVENVPFALSLSLTPGAAEDMLALSFLLFTCIDFCAFSVVSDCVLVLMYFPFIDDGRLMLPFSLPVSSRYLFKCVDELRLLSDLDRLKLARSNIARFGVLSDFFRCRFDISICSPKISIELSCFACIGWL